MVLSHYLVAEMVLAHVLAIHGKEIRVFPYLPLLGFGVILLSGLGVGLLGLALWILPPRLNRLVSAV